MSANMHSSGPWYVSNGNVIKSSTGGDIALSLAGYQATRDANARLIAAAPDLLDMLEDALPYVEEGEEFNKPSRRGLSKAIRATITKVRGE